MFVIDELVLADGDIQKREYEIDDRVEGFSDCPDSSWNYYQKSKRYSRHRHWKDKEEHAARVRLLGVVGKSE